MHGDVILQHSFESSSTMPFNWKDHDINCSVKMFKDFFVTYFYTLQPVEIFLLYLLPQMCIFHNAHIL